MGAVMCCETRESDKAVKDKKKKKQTPQNDKSTRKHRKRELSDDEEDIELDSQISVPMIQMRKSIRKTEYNPRDDESMHELPPLKTNNPEILERSTYPMIARDTMSVKSMNRGISPRSQANALAASVKDDSDGISNSSSSDDEDDDEDWNMGFVRNSIKMSDEEIAKLQETLDLAGQGHLLQYVPELTPIEKQTLFLHISQINPTACTELYKSSMGMDQASTGPSSKHLSGLAAFNPEASDDEDAFSAAPKLTTFEGAMVLALGAREDNDKCAAYADCGKTLIKEGKIALVIYGGDRIQYDGSDKQYSAGMADTGLPSKKTSYQILIEKFIRAQMNAHDAKKNSKKIQKCQILLMTSQEDIVETKLFLRENNYFGAKKENFTIFPQGMVPQVDLDGKIILGTTHEIQMQPAGSGSIFESICNNEKVKEALNKVEYCQIVDVTNYCNTILDPVAIGFTHKNDLHASMKVFDRSSIPNGFKKEGGLFVVKKKNKIDFVTYSQAKKWNQLQGQIKMAVASETASPILNAANLISMCESRSNLDKLYERKFDKIPIFDEEDDETVIPEKENGYKFTLDIHKFYQFVQFGGKAESQVSLGSGIDHSSNIGFIVQEKDNFDREFYFFQSDECDPAFLSEDRLEQAKETFIIQGKHFVDDVIDEENAQKYDKKRIEINPMKSAGVGDKRDQNYINKLNTMNVLPDRNKRKGTYVQ